MKSPKNDLISVIIPTYNRANSICKTVESVLAQTYSPVEVIVVNDGSTDDTKSRLESYGENIRVVNQQNGGPSAARHAGAQVSRGEFLAFIDSDDIWLPEFLERCTSALHKAGSGTPCCVTNAVLQRTSGKHKRNTSFDSSTLYSRHSEGLWWNATEVLVSRFVQTSQTSLIRRTAYDKAGGFDPSLRYNEDLDLALRLSLLGPWAFIAEPLVIWRQSEDSISLAVLRNNLPFRECELRMWRRFEKLAEPYGQRLVRKVRRQAAKSQAILDSSSSGMQTKPSGSGPLRKAYRLFDRATRAAYRRTPWYPKMKTSPFANQG
jgi:glycosyltransferase involved in cell wall biosynthesis